ncbi:ATP-binding cassette domain-containing protein (plasmid) [Bacillus sp. CMF21]|nr:ATP-binding cassette domain-containing protein [Bacillus sp. CMF21]
MELKNPTKQYKVQTVVDSLAFSVKEGEFFALFGENSAGKTTLIKMLCGLLTPTSEDATVLNIIPSTHFPASSINLLL